MVDEEGHGPAMAQLELARAPKSENAKNGGLDHLLPPS